MRAVRRPLWQRGYATLAGCWRGLLVCALVALAARFLAGHYGVPVMLMALLLGMALNFLSAEQTCQPGIDLASRQVLRWGVALLGLRVSLDQVLALGWGTVLMVVVSVLVTMVMGLVMARLLGLRRDLGLVTGGAVGICGASAALALSSCLPRDARRERDLAWTVMGVSILSTLAMSLPRDARREMDLAWTVMGVSILSTLAMLAYPLLAGALSLSTMQTGVFLGGSIHDVAQVVGAGYSVSAVSGDTAVLTKLMRVAMLVPVLLMVSLVLYYKARQRHAEPAPTPPDAPLLPGFALAFVALVLLQSALKLPPAWLTLGQDLSQGALILAMAAIGLKAQPAQWRAMGWRPVLLLVGETVFLAALVLGWLFWIPV